MRPIPAPRIGDSHGLLRAIGQRERIRLDEFVTEFSVEDLFPPGLENALGRTRQFVSYARAAGLLKEDRGTVELTEIGKRYVRAGDPDSAFEVSDAQAEWLRRQVLEKHMTDSIYHGLAIGLSLLSSVPPGTRVSVLDFGRALGYLGRAGWDSDNTLQIQGERYLLLLRDIAVIDGERGLTPTGTTLKDELTLPIHMSLLDIAAQLNPGGAEAVRAEAEAEHAAATEPEPEPEAAPEPPAAEEEWTDAGPSAFLPAVKLGEAEPPPPPPAPPPPPTPAQPAEPAPAPSAGPPAPPADIWETAAPEDATRAYEAVRQREAAPAQPPAPAEPAPRPVAPAPEPPSVPETPTVVTPPRPPLAPVPPLAAPPAAPAAPDLPPAAAAHRAPSDFLSAGAIRTAAEGQGLRLPGSVYANLAAALASGKHVVLTGPPGAGKTTLALAVAQAAAAAGRSAGAVLVTAAERWSAADTLGRRPRQEGEAPRPGHVLDAARRGKWLVVDELDRAQLDRALGALSTFLAGLPVTLAGGEEVSPPGDWRMIATAAGGPGAGSAALLRRFAHVAVPPLAGGDLDALIVAAAGGDGAAAAAARRLLVLRELRPLGAGVFADAARHAAERNAIEPADERTLAREAYGAYVQALLGGLDEREEIRLRELVESL